VTRQVLANYADQLQQRFATDYRKGDLESFKKHSAAFLDLIADMDRLLSTQKTMMLGPWLNAAKKWGTAPGEKALYERNARDLITLWGDQNSILHEYACRQWSGLLRGFYRPRWEQFRNEVLQSMQAGKPFDAAGFETKIKGWEWTWVNAHEIYPDIPQGNAVTITQQLYRKYYQQLTSL
jgi:alpha-N-acetylglucosaminidase